MEFVTSAEPLPAPAAPAEFHAVVVFSSLAQPLASVAKVPFCSTFSEQSETPFWFTSSEHCSAPPEPPLPPAPSPAPLPPLPPPLDPPVPPVFALPPAPPLPPLAPLPPVFA